MTPIGIRSPQGIRWAVLFRQIWVDRCSVVPTVFSSIAIIFRPSHDLANCTLLRRSGLNFYPLHSSMGNPKKSPDQLRRHTVKVSLNDAELEQLKAKTQGRSLGKFCREAALSGTVQESPLQSVPSVNRAKWMELGKVGSNLNQIARHLNRGEWIEAEAIEQTVEQTLAELRQLRKELIGQ